NRVAISTTVSVEHIGPVRARRQSIEFLSDRSMVESYCPGDQRRPPPPVRSNSPRFCTGFGVHLQVTYCRISTASKSCQRDSDRRCLLMLARMHVFLGHGKALAFYQSASANR